MSTKMVEMIDQINALRIVPVVTIPNVDVAGRMADALCQGGLPCAEITLRTEAGLAAIQELSDRPAFLVGAGTVHNAEQAQQAVDAGADFIVAPGFNPKTVRWCLDNDVLVIPGISSPTDLEMALEFGLNVVKFFPAEALGGVPMLKALSGPYPGMKFMPTGGIRQDNLREYLDLPQVIACGGSWMVAEAYLAKGRFESIVDRTTEAVLLARNGRPSDL
ncbi:Putative KHG/KDPG aldolase [Roseimaritima multifibrata]|uniref:2-dehydro-3-deoxy-phosphogluconate aldolase n=1 Tax=Roseimaritima multifibrata TaxID=1930274 RepID=A0A517MAE4_9BACT|nr:bifunctional 4-hydroxy-2-oxoglutarate aldolase/2-dehydro-3-deoxy-phosphogluconate aldolase [Roseimaritima multifibrata]QDS91860.1 Putative KHG/KDPG aldolase [Roseimaritima multifibrata]